MAAAFARVSPSARGRSPAHRHGGPIVLRRARPSAGLGHALTHAWGVHPPATSPGGRERAAKPTAKMQLILSGLVDLAAQSLAQNNSYCYIWLFIP